MEQFGLRTLERFVSPVFFSSDQHGVLHQGLDHLPTTQGGTRPLLFIGNHQLFAPDTPIMVSAVLRQKGMLLRGLAHPFAMQGAPDRGALAGPPPFGRFLETFGAVPVSGRNLHALLEAGEAALLYPGGAREVRRGEAGWGETGNWVAKVRSSLELVPLSLPVITSRPGACWQALTPQALTPQAWLDACFPCLALARRRSSTRVRSTRSSGLTGRSLCATQPSLAPPSSPSPASALRMA